MQKPLPFDEQTIRRIAEQYPTPFYLYDEEGMRESCRSLNSAFSWCPGFREYFAVKALPNPYVLEVLKAEGLGADCSSLAELALSERVGLTGEDLMFTSNNTQVHEYQRAVDLGAIINLDDLTHIDYLKDNVGLPELLCFRYNPGSAREGNHHWQAGRSQVWLYGSSAVRRLQDSSRRRCEAIWSAHDGRIQ